VTELAATTGGRDSGASGKGVRGLKGVSGLTARAKAKGCAIVGAAPKKEGAASSAVADGGKGRSAGISAAAVA
jgi:hypothetical protein